MQPDFDTLANQLAPHYSLFDVSNRLLFTGHSHQAWPDVAREGQLEYFDVSAQKVDKKWEQSFQKAEKLRAYLRRFYDDSEGMYCLEQNTHVLLVSWLSSLPLTKKNRIVTTDSEFHSMFRQLKRLEEEGLEIVRIPILPDETFSERFLSACNKNTAAVMLSRVYFESSLINMHISEIASCLKNQHIPMLIDDYHGTNAVPLSIKQEQLEHCFLLIGGYKYLQWGEGNCFLRFPKECEFRPAITGWFSAFETLEHPRTSNPVTYDAGNQRFATATYDSSSQFRAAKVVEFFESQKLSPELLRRQNALQIAYMSALFKSMPFDNEKIKLKHSFPLERNGGFLAFETPMAAKYSEKLLELGVFTDARNTTLRFGPAPYTTSQQIESAMHLLYDVLKK